MPDAALALVAAGKPWKMQNEQSDCHSDKMASLGIPGQEVSSTAAVQ